TIPSSAPPESTWPNGRPASAAPWGDSRPRRRPATWPSDRTAGHSSPWAMTGRCIAGTRAPGARRIRQAPPRPAARGETAWGGAWRSGTRAVFDRAGRGLCWDAVRRRRTGPTLTPPGQSAVRAVAFGEGGRRLVTCDADGTLRWWDAATGQPVCGYPPGTGGG